jgi:precorrin-6Y C5,15-methyltransferase (decarboxylating)
VLASGDPGLFGIVRVLDERFGAGALQVHPAPSAISLAFARLGCSWDDARVVSAHGRPLDDALDQILPAPKVAVLTSPDHPPQAIGAALLAAGSAPRTVSVLTRIGEPGERRFDGDLEQLATGTFDPMSIVILRDPASAARHASLAWGLPERRFRHRRGMITKAEVRAVALGKLDVPGTGVLWDVGAGSGSVAIEAARLSPRLQVIAIDSDPESVDRIQSNAAAHAVDIDVVHGHAPDVLATLPDPDRVFVGGGGIGVLDAVLARLRPGGVVVANYALVDRATAAWQRLGNLVELSVARGVATGELGVRLSAENPVFICWGPEHDDPEEAHR